VTRTEGDPFAPYPVWFTMTLIVRGSQMVFIICCIWYLVALFDAFDKEVTTSIPPNWLWLTTIFLGTSSAGGRRWRLSPFGDTVANRLAKPFCPSCGQDIYDPTPATGYASPVDREAWLPSRFCGACGHDLAQRKAAA
jgi:hypothetical protein